MAFYSWICWRVPRTRRANIAFNNNNKNVLQRREASRPWALKSRYFPQGVSLDLVVDFVQHRGRYNRDRRNNTATNPTVWIWHSPQETSGDSLTISAAAARAWYLKTSSQSLTSVCGNMRSPWLAVATGNFRFVLRLWWRQHHVIIIDGQQTQRDTPPFGMDRGGYSNNS